MPLLTLCCCLQDYAPDVYATTKYTLIEISPVMAERQRQRVMHEHPVQCEVINTDILTYTDTHAPVNRACFFLAMEVLDNLPHDKVTLQNGKWYETLVQIEESHDQTLKLDEALRPVEDHLVRQTLKYFGCDLPLSVQYKINSALARKVRKLFGKDDQELHSAFIPTGSMQLLNTLRMSFPKHHLIAADFDALPAPNLDPKSPVKALDHPLSPTATSTGTLCAGNAPVVASKTTGATDSSCLYAWERSRFCSLASGCECTGTTQDHDTYLVQGGIADIFFATDFARLKKAYCSTQARKPEEVLQLSLSGGHSGVSLGNITPL